MVLRSQWIFICLGLLALAKICYPQHPPEQEQEQPQERDSWASFILTLIRPSTAMPSPVFSEIRSGLISSSSMNLKSVTS